MKNIHLIEVTGIDKAKGALFADSLQDGNLTRNYNSQIEFKDCKYFNLYITCDEEIKGGYAYYPELNEVLLFDNKHGEVYEKGRQLKIILTADQDLIKDGVQAIDDEFLEWFVKNPTCEYVKVNDLYNYTNENTEHIGYKIIIPKEETHQLCNTGVIIQEPKQETLEEAANKFAKLLGNNDDEILFGLEENAFIEGAKWQAEQDKNKYSEEEVQQLLSFIREVRDNWDCDTDAHRYNTPCRCCEATQILEQFKKK